jgi:perosamine synthetase
MKKNISFFYPKKTGYEINLVKKVLNSGNFNDGKLTKLFENKIKKKIKRKYCICVTSGTIAIYIALKANNINESHEVIIPCFTYIATANAVKLTGAKIVLADIDPNSYTINYNDFVKKITKKTKAVVTVEVNGLSPEYKKFINICKKKRIIIITDSTEAFGAKKNNYILGSVGDASCLSFSPSKIISTGQGGIVATNKKNIYEKIRTLKQQGLKKTGSGGGDKFYNEGYNFKFTDLQAAVGLGQIKYFEKRKKIFRLRNKIYYNLLKNLNYIKLSEYNDNKLWFDINVNNLKLKKKIQLILKKNNINFRTFWLPINKHQIYRSNEKFPVTEKISKTGIWLPSNFDITFKQIKFIVDKIKYAINNFN